MHTAFLLGVVCTHLLSPALAIPGTVAFDVHRQVNLSLVGEHKETSQSNGSDSTVPISNHASWYGVTLELGTPPQKVTVQIDTGSSDLWVASPFSPTLSTTFDGNTSDAFSINYGDGSGAYGYHATDTLRLSDNVTIQRANFAFADVATADPAVFGIGYVGNEAGSRYDNIPVQLKEQGFISALAYSLYLGDTAASSATGEVLFGGVDHSKYVGQLFRVPITQPAAFFVSLDSINHEGSAIYSTPQSVLLDSGTTELVLPIDMAAAIVRAIDPTAVPFLGGTSVQCSQIASSKDVLSFNFSGASIPVPVQNLVDPGSLNADGSIPTSGDCYLGIQIAFEYPYILGDRFLIGAYVVYDLDNHEVSLASAAVQSSAPKVEVISAHGVPGAVDAPNYRRNGNNASTSTNELNNGSSSSSANVSRAGGANSASVTTSADAPVDAPIASAPPTLFPLGGDAAAADASSSSIAQSSITRLAKVRNSAARCSAARRVGATIIILLFFSLASL